jgi:hypothetical protein
MQVKETGMKALLSTVVVAAIGALAAPAYAVDAKVQSAIKVFEQTAADTGKMKTYCAMSKLMADVGDDEKKAEAAEKQLDGYLKELGADFEQAWSVGDGLDENSDDGKALNEALDKLDEKCS